MFITFFSFEEGNVSIDRTQRDLQLYCSGVSLRGGRFNRRTGFSGRESHEEILGLRSSILVAADCRNDSVFQSSCADALLAYVPAWCRTATEAECNCMSPRYHLIVVDFVVSHIFCQISHLLVCLDSVGVVVCCRFSCRHRISM